MIHDTDREMRAIFRTSLILILLAVLLVIWAVKDAFASQTYAALPTTGTLSGLTAVTDINSNFDAVATSFAATTTPSAPLEAGQLWYNTGSSTLEIYNGSTWSSVGGGGGGSTAMSSFTAATTTSSINNGSYALTWNWNGLTTQTGLSLSTTSETTGTLFALNNTNTAQSGATLSILDSTTSSGYGISSTVSGHANTGYAGYFANTATGGASYGVYASDSSSTGYAVYASGAVNITGALTGAAASFSGTLTGVAANLSGALTGTSAIFSSTVTGANFNTTGTFTGGSASLSGTLTGVGVNLSGNLNLATNGIVQLGTNSFTDTGVALQATTSTNSYYQTILANTSTGAAASVAYTTAISSTTSTNNYGEFGQNSLNFTGTGNLNKAGAVFLDSVGQDLALGTTTTNAVHFVINSGATDAMSISTTGVVSIANLNVTNCTGCTGSSAVSSVSGDGTFITNSASTGAVTLALGTAAANTVWGNNTGSTTTPAYTNAPSVNSLNVAGSSAPTNGLYLPATNTVGISANSIEVATFNTLTSGADYFTVTPGKSGTAVKLGVNGTTANQSLSITATGTGTVSINGLTATTSGSVGAITNGFFNTAASGNTLQINGTGVSAVTGTGSVALSASPTFTGTVGAATITATGVVTGQAFVAPPSTLSISSSTFTPVAVGSNTFRVVLVHASCPCTIAAPSGTAVDGAKFILEVWQSSSGSDTVSWTTGSSGSYDFGTAGAPTLSTGASKGDFIGFSYSSQNSRYNYIGIQQGM